MKHNWEYKPFTDIAISITPRIKIDKSDYLPEGLVPIISQEEVYISGYWDNSDDITPHNGPVVIFGDHSRVLKYVECDFVVGADGVKIISPNNCISAKFLYHFLKWYNIPSLGYSRHFKLIKEASIPVPPMEVQQQIVVELDKINEVIEDCRELLRNLDALAQSLFYDYFGDPVINPKGWTLKQWSDCLNIINGKNQKAVENPNGQFPIYGSGGIMSYADAYLCPEYCTIIGRKGNISKPIFVKTKFWNVDTAFGLCPDKSILIPLYLYFFCKNYDFEKHNKAVTIPSLVKSDLLKIQIPIPPLVLQEKFAERIEQIDAQKKAVEETIANLQTLLDSRMDYWFN